MVGEFKYDKQEIFVPGLTFEIIASLLQIVFSAVSFWMGIVGKRAIDKRVTFYLLLVLVLLNATLMLPNTIDVISGLSIWKSPYVGVGR